jgi:hypothetical protein
MKGRMKRKKGKTRCETGEERMESEGRGKRSRFVKVC